MSLDDATLPPLGRLLAGKYRLERLIGKGGMGAVYAAHHELLDQPVAIKLLLGDAASDPTAAARFLNEARAAARIPSDHVVRVLDVGLDGRLPYLVMERLEGKDLGHMLTERGRLPEQEVVGYVLEAIEAVAQAHAIGIIHRDLKPSNIFVAERPHAPRIVKVLDFGIAKAFGASAITQATAVTTQGLVGSPAYMAPEYVRSAKSIDTRADIWAFGVVLYELLTGEMPFAGDNAGEVLAAILEKTPRPLQSLRPDLSPRVVAVVARCLQRNPDERWADLADVAEALLPIASQRSPSIASIRETTRALRARPPADASGRMRALQLDADGAPVIPAGAGRDDETMLAPGHAVQQTNKSWSDGVLPAPPPTRAMKLAAALGGATGALALVAIFFTVSRAHAPAPSGSSIDPVPPAPSVVTYVAPPSAAPTSASDAPAPSPPPAPSATATAGRPAPTPASPVAKPARRAPRASPPPSPAVAAPPTLARDRR